MLRGGLHYMRRPTPSVLLGALARFVRHTEDAGLTVEAMLTYPSSDMDWVGVVLVQDPDNPSGAVAE
jgi:hypothetical protein